MNRPALWHEKHMTPGISAQSFQPRIFLKNRHVQSVLASVKGIVPSSRALIENSRNVILTSRGGAKLLACVCDAPNPRGIIILLHGWEGSSESAYMLAAGAYFHARGLSICRLNLRDHGESHHLNVGLFHGALLDEVFDAVASLANEAKGLPVYLMGFSLGANFALRIALKHAQTPIDPLKQVFAVSPPFDPYKTTLTIDNGPPFYRQYFLKKWKRSLQKKQALFPDKYDFSGMLSARTCLALTADILKYYPEFPSYREYFQFYTLSAESFARLTVPVVIFIALDDPVIALEDMESLRETELMQISRQPFGGHCGFIDLFPYRRWYHDEIFKRMGLQDP